MSTSVDRLTFEIIGCAIEVHRILGPGLLESAYEECLCHELNRHRLEYVRQVPLPILYKTVVLEHGYRIDIVVQDRVILEIKSVESLSPLHMAQILTYLRLSKKNVGLLINFNVLRLRQGLKRVVL